MFETLFSGTAEGGTFYYNVSYLIYLKHALLCAGVVIALSTPAMPYFALIPGFAWKTAVGKTVLFAKWGFVHSAFHCVRHLILTPTENALVGAFLDPKDYWLVMDPVTPNSRTGMELADFLQ